MLHCIAHMRLFDILLDILFPPPVPVTVFNKLPKPTAHDHYPWILAGTNYRSDARAIVRYLKKTPDHVYLEKCAALMARQLEAYSIEESPMNAPHIHIIPVPQHRSNTRHRGFSQSALLAKHIAKILPYVTYSDILEKPIRTEKQALLPRHKRLVNQMGSIRMRDDGNMTLPQPSSLIVIVDDVSTTGSTLLACKTALVERGFTNILGLVFAH